MQCCTILQSYRTEGWVFPDTRENRVGLLRGGADSSPFYIDATREFCQLVLAMDRNSLFISIKQYFVVGVYTCHRCQ